MIHSLLRTLNLFLSVLPMLCQGWETGNEYLYDYSGLLVTGIDDADHKSAAVQIIAKLTVQSVDDETLMLKMSEIRITREGNYSSRLSDPISFPVGIAEGEKEAIDGDSLHLLSNFAVIHNKGLITNLVVESDEPTWSVNIKKAVVSNLQLDVSGVRSGLDGGVFGERNTPTLSSLEDGVTGDCFTTLRITRLPFYQVIQNQDLETHKIIGDLCRSTKVFEVVKTKDFDQCQKDPLKMLSNPISSSFMLQRFSAYKYLACGESAEKNTIVRMEGIGKLEFSGSIKLNTRQIVNLVIQRRGQIRNILPPLSQPQVIDDLTFSFEKDSSTVSAKEVETIFEALQEVAQTLMESTLSEDDILKKLSIISGIVFRLGESQLRQIWQRAGNTTARDLFVDCIATSGSHTAVVFLVDLIERRELKGFEAVWTLMSSGYSMQHPKISTLRQFMGIIRSEAASVSKLLKHTALMASADLLYTSCVLLPTANCNSDAQIITEEFLPLLVHELETAQTEIDRFAAIFALGALGTDDVLLLLVPYIRGENVASRIAAIMSLNRIMDFSPDKVIPLLASLADNVAEHPEIRMAAISMLLVHKKTSLNIWKKIASRTWFDASHRVAVFTCDIIYGQARSSEDESTSIKARSVIGIMRPCSGRSEHYASVKDNSELSSLLAFWRLKDSPMPVDLLHLFRQLGSFRLHLAKVSIWNLESVWSQFLKHDDNILKSSEPNALWDQLFSNFQTNDQATVGLFYARLLGSTMQMLFNLEDIDREYMMREFFTRHINIRFVKFQQLIDIRTYVPTELGLPARFTFSLTALASAFGHIHQPEINVTAALSLKWVTDSSIQCPFSGHHVTAGVDNIAEIRAPIFLISNGSLVWTLPDRIYDLAYFNIKPYAFTSQTTDHSSETLQLAKANHISTQPTSVSVAQLSLFRLETTRTELPQEDPASAWLNSLMKEYSDGHFRLDDFQQRVYRLRYLPKEVQSPLSTVSLSASFNTEDIHENADVQYILGVNGSMEWDEDGTNGTNSLFRMKDDSIHVYKGGITVHYYNGSMLNWAAVEIVGLSKENEWDITASDSTIASIRNWLNYNNIEYSQGGTKSQEEVYSNASKLEIIHFKESQVPFLPYLTLLFTAKDNLNSEKRKKNKCFIHSDRVVTYDGVEYKYTINECHHLLTADCGQKSAKYTIMGTNESHGMVVRITLEKDVIDVSSAGNISINGIEANFTSNRMRIHMGDRVIATATLNKNNAINLRLLDEDLDVFVEKSTITLRAGSKLLGNACGMCGDGDSEVTGEFKTRNRCALSSGTLMATSFQMGLENSHIQNCPSMTDEVLQALLMESYPCYSVDEQVASFLPLPLEL